MNDKLKATGFVVLVLAGATFLGFGAWAFYQVGQTSKASRETPDKLNETLEMLNRPCNAKDANGKVLRDGVFCNFDKLTVSFRRLADETQGQVKNTKQIADATSRSMDKITEHLTPVLDSVKTSTDKVGDLADSGKRLSDAGTVAIYQFNTNSMPLYAKSNEALDNINTYLKDKRISQILDNVNSTSYNIAGVTGHFDKISGDLQVVTDRAVAPKTTGEKIREWTPFGIKAGISLGCLIYGPC